MFQRKAKAGEKRIEDRNIRDKEILVPMRSGETPVPIPNTMVKTWAADGTMLETAWESRWVPDFYKRAYSSAG